jgi:hypothetical protein
MDATPGTPLSGFKSRTLEGVEDKRIYHENVSFLSEIYGNLTHRWLIASTPASLTGGFDAKQSIQGVGDPLLVMPPQSTHEVAIGCCATPNGESPPTTGFFTAWMHRGPGGGIGTSYPQPTWGTLSHNSVTLYRNGEQVFFGHNPTQQQIDAASTQDGSYFQMFEVDERSLAPWTHPYPDTRRSDPRMFKTFSSFVRDSVPPVLGFTPVDDFYVSNFALQPNRFVPTKYGARLVATEPVSSPYGPLAAMYDESPTSVTTRPVVGTVRVSQNFAVGTHTFPSNTFWTVGQFADSNGNRPAVAPTCQYTVHPLPTVASEYSHNLADGFNHRGSRPTLEDPGLQTSEYWRPRLETEKVSTLILTFDRKVVANQVASSQLTLTKDGEPVEGCTLEQIDDFRWRVTVPVQPQTPRSFFLLTYDPAGEVFTDDIAQFRYDRRSDFPSVGQWKAVYIHPDENGEDVRYYYGRGTGLIVGPLSYIQLQSGEPPLDPYGTPYTPEPCVLATRVGWLMADMNGYPRLIDTTSFEGPYQIGRIASVHDDKSFDHEKKHSLVGGTGGVYFPHVFRFNQPVIAATQHQALGIYSPLLNFDGYTPSVPSLTDPAADCSYFGLTTTIDPCPPAKVSLCASPKVAQKHASAIRCNGDITSLKVSLVAIDANGNPDDLSGLQYGTAAQSTVFPGTDFRIITDVFGAPPYWTTRTIASQLLLLNGAELTFGTTLDGETLCQNVWSCVEGARTAQLPIQPSQSRPAANIGASYPDRGINEGLRAYEFNIPNNQNGVPDLRNVGESSLTFKRGSPQVDVWNQSQSGIVRSLTGSIKQKGLQGIVSAYRSHRTYSGLNTTVLGELVIRVSLRVTMEATVTYRDVKVKPLLWRAFFGFVGPNNWVFGTWQEIQDALVNYDPTQPGTQHTRLTGFCSYDQGQQLNQKTVTHHFLGDVDDGFALTKEKEEALAAGEPVYVLLSPKFLGGGTYWKIQKG